MLNKSLFDVLHRQDLSQKDQVLIILADEEGEPKTSLAIRTIAAAHGIPAARNWNIAAILATGVKGYAAQLEQGWMLTSAGRSYLKSRKLVASENAVTQAATDLRQHLAAVANADTKAFLEEAVGCLESDLLRAAVVFSWVGAMSVLYQEVVSKHLASFNTEARRRDPKWRDAVTTDDLARMKEHDFLDVIEHLSLIGRNVKLELQSNCLKLRNACGHPNSLQIGRARVAAHIEVLIQNVFSKF